MRISGAMNAVLCAALIIGISSGSFLHSLIPHTHSAHAHSHTHAHSHPGEKEKSESESSVWVTLHSALRHEDKKMFFALMLLIDATAHFATRIDTVRLSLVTQEYRTYLEWDNRKPTDVMTGEWLSNGISPYRRFA